MLDQVEERRAPPSGCPRTSRRAASSPPCSQGACGPPRRFHPRRTGPWTCQGPRRHAPPPHRRHRRAPRAWRALDGRIRLADIGGLPEDLEERPERDASPIGKAAAADERGVVADRLAQLCHERGLPDTGLAEDCDHAHEPARRGLAKRPAQVRQLRVAADHRALALAQRSLGPPDGYQSIRRHALGLPLECERLDGLNSTRSRTSRCVMATDEDLVGGAACSRRAATLTASPARAAVRGRLARDHLAGVHADAVRRSRPNCARLLVQLLERSRISAAARTARRASSSCSWGARTPP